MDPEPRRRAALAAAGRAPFDLVISRVRLVNVFTGEIYPAHIGVTAGLIAAVLPGDGPVPDGAQLVEGDGRYAVPGLIDSHLHVESSMVLPPAFAAAIVPRGILTIIADPHEIANVMGFDGMRLFVEAGRGLPLDCFWQVPSCVPASPLETSGAAIGPDEVEELLSWPEMIALGEVMDFPGVIAQSGRTADILSRAVALGTVIEGHAPNLSGRELAAYVTAGVNSDHTLVTPELALERLRAGVTLQLQLKSLAPKTLEVAEAFAKSLNLCLVTDDVLPDDLESTGHLDHILRTAVKRGLSPVEAIRAVTLSPARRMRLYDRGAIAPGMVAHIVLTPSLGEFRAEEVFHRGQLVARDGRLVTALPEFSVPEEALRTVRLAPPGPDAFVVAVERPGSTARVRVMALSDRNTYTAAEQHEIPVAEGRLQWEGAGLCLAAVFERHGRAGTRGLGLLRNALERGAVASTWAHDSHNLLVIGRSAGDMAAAARWAVENGGGMAAVLDGTVIAAVHLPVGGIVSPRSVAEVAAEVRRFREALGRLGFHHPIPFMALGALTLAVSPELKVTDKGLVDVQRGQIVDLFVA
ncbi:MAG: adenine deaminase [Firmicutes bacterium]|nr:adenine deaminase [Bacillota bacterium]